MHTITCRTAEARAKAGEQILISPAPCPCGGSAPLPVSAEIKAGTRPGFVEIHFPTKPPAADLSALRSARYRYAANPPRWYGLARNAPAAYAPAVEALAALQA